LKHGEIIVGLDLGSSRTKAIVADVRDREIPEILGIGESRSVGIEAGVIVSMERAADSIREAIVKAEESTDVEIGAAAISLNGEHIKGIDSRGVIAVSGANGEITASEVATVLEAARTLALPVGRSVVDVLPQEFFVDGQRGIRNPVGMSGVRLGSKVHIVTAEEQVIDSAIRAVRMAGLRESIVTAKPVAAGLSSLSDDERELGVLLVNIGADTTGVALHHGESIRYIGIVGWGASSITSDIAVGFRMPLVKAEFLKRESGCAKLSMVENSVLEIPSVGGRSPRESSTHMLSAIIEPRVREILELALAEVRDTEYWGRTAAGVVLTGGGAKLRGVPEVAEDVFGLPARVGLPDRVSGLFDAIADPSYAAAVGVVMAASRAPRKRRRRSDGAVFGTVRKVRQWVDSLL
jgi:cell division protein FtsA